MSPIMEFKRHTIFGWTYFYKELPAGYRYSVVVPTDTSFAAAKTIAYWVAGNVVGESNVRGRAAGDLTDLSLSLPAGKYIWKVESDTKWWCTHAVANDGAVPDVTKVIIEADDTATFNSGTLLFLAEGVFKVNGGEAVQGPKPYKVVTDGTTFKAVTKTYGLTFAKER